MDNKTLLKRLEPIADMAGTSIVDIDYVDNPQAAFMHLGFATHALDTVVLMIGQIIDDIQEEDRQWDDYLKKRDGKKTLNAEA